MWQARWARRARQARRAIWAWRARRVRRARGVRRARRVRRASRRARRGVGRNPQRVSGRGRGGGNRGGGRGKKNAASKKSAADQAKLAAFLLNKYGPGGSRLAAAEAVATSADEEVVFEGEKTREERDAELRGGRVAGLVRQCRWTILGVCAA